MLLLLSFFLEGIPNLTQPLPYYLSLIWLSAVSASAFSIWFYLLKVPGVKVSELNLWKFVIPVSGAALSWLVLPDESPTIAAVAGMVLVAVSIIFYNLFQLFQPNFRPGNQCHVLAFFHQKLCAGFSYGTGSPDDGNY